MSNNALRLNLKQTQLLNQNLQQSLQVLHMSSLRLEETVSTWLEDNPFLERIEPEAEADTDSATAGEYVQPSRPPPNSTENTDIWATVAAEPSLYQQLHQQVCEYALNPPTAACVHLLIDNLNEQGYLDNTLTDLVENSPLEWRLNEALLNQALKILQQFDPPGVGARNLAESLHLQLLRHPPSAARDCAQIIVQHHLGQWQNGAQFKALCRQLPHHAPRTVQAACTLIESLSPYPNYGFDSTTPVPYIQPDIHIYPDDNGQWQVEEMRSAWPQLRINPDYQDWLSQSDLEPVCKAKWQEAQTHIDSLKMRQSTVMRLAHWILQKQQDFFLFGPIGLAPLTIKETAVALGLAESTISRAANQKYLTCPQGVFALRYFFNHAVSQTPLNASGSSQTAVKTLIEHLIQQEDKTAPYADNELVAQLAQQGITLARRTIAKYREALKIPPAHQRKLHKPSVS